MFCNNNNNKKKVNYLEHEKLRHIVRDFMKDSRYEHTLAVEKEAVKLAEIYDKGDDADFINKLRSAAILHDITKELSVDKHFEICEKYRIKLTDEDKAIQKVLHAKTAAYIAVLEFGADDDMTFWGIYNHTLGGVKHFSIFAKIIYLSDYIEPMRTFIDCVEVRDYFYSNIEKADGIKDKQKVLDETILYSMNKTIESLIKENLLIHSDAVICRNKFID